MDLITLLCCQGDDTVHQTGGSNKPSPRKGVASKASPTKKNCDPSYEQLASRVKELQAQNKILLTASSRDVPKSDGYGGDVVTREEIGKITTEKKLLQDVIDKVNEKLITAGKEKDALENVNRKLRDEMDKMRDEMDKMCRERDEAVKEIAAIGTRKDKLERTFTREIKKYRMENKWLARRIIDMETGNAETGSDTGSASQEEHSKLDDKCDESQTMVLDDKEETEDLPTCDSKTVDHVNTPDKIMKDDKTHESEPSSTSDEVTSSQIPTDTSSATASGETKQRSTTMVELGKTKEMYDKVLKSFEEKETQLVNVNAALSTAEEQVKSLTQKVDQLECLNKQPTNESEVPCLESCSTKTNHEGTTTELEEHKALASPKNATPAIEESNDESFLNKPADNHAPITRDMSDGSTAQDIELAALETSLYEARESNEALRAERDGLSLVLSEEMRPALEKYEAENLALVTRVKELEASYEAAVGEIETRQVEMERLQKEFNSQANRGENHELPGAVKKDSNGPNEAGGGAEETNKNERMDVVECEAAKKHDDKDTQLYTQVQEVEADNFIDTKEIESHAKESLQQVEARQTEIEELVARVAQLEHENKRANDEIVQLGSQLIHALANNDKESEQAHDELQKALSQSQIENEKLSAKVAEYEAKVRKADGVSSTSISNSAILITPEKPILHQADTVAANQGIHMDAKENVSHEQETIANNHELDVAKNDNAKLKFQLLALKVALKRAEENVSVITEQSDVACDASKKELSALKLMNLALKATLKKERDKLLNLVSKSNDAMANERKCFEDTCAEKDELILALEADLAKSQALVTKLQDALGAAEMVIRLKDSSEELAIKAKEKKIAETNAKRRTSQSRRDSETLCSPRKELKQSQTHSVRLEEELKGTDGTVKRGQSSPSHKGKMMRLSGNIKVCVRVRPFFEGESRDPPLVLSPPSARASYIPMQSTSTVRGWNNDNPSSPQTVLQSPSSYSSQASVDSASIEQQQQRYPFVFVDTSDDASTVTSEGHSISTPTCQSTVVKSIHVYEQKSRRKGLKHGTPQHRTIKHRFDADHVFPPACTQAQVWSVACEPFVQKAIDGENICLFSYGQCGSGKTFTMIGEVGGEGEGILFRSVRKLFATKEYIESYKKHVVDIYLEFVEIHNDKVHDLLSPNLKSPPRVSLRETNKTICVKSEEDMMYLLKITQQKQFQKESHKKHLIVTLSFAVVGLSDMNESYTGRLRIVDLGGTGAAVSNTHDSPEKRIENQSVAQSLNALRGVVERLKQSSSGYVPYRDSKLTFNLIDSLEGDACTVAIICCSPHSAHVSESLASLRFGRKLMTDGNGDGILRMSTTDEGMKDDNDLEGEQDDANEDSRVRKMLSYFEGTDSQER